MLKKFKASNEVVTLENSFLDNNGNFYMVFELADSNLDALIKLLGNRLVESDIMKIFVQILRGIYILHENNVAHGDIKLENIFVFKNKSKLDNEESWCLKIGDLGFSSDCDDKTLLNNFSGSPLYAAPEITLSLPYNGLKSDIWSFGVVVYFLFYGRFPFDVEDDGNISLLFHKIQNEDIDIEESMRGVSDDCVHLISSLLIKNPLDRPNIQQIINHPWIVKNILWIS